MDKHKVDDGTALVGFELPSQVEASTVSVCGDFNGWTAHAHPLARQADGSFRTEIALPTGDRWTFRYLVDGARWENDWSADAYEPNGLGQDNSVVDLTHPEGLPLLAAADAPAGPIAPGGHGHGHGHGHGAPEPGEATEEVAAPGLLHRWWLRLTGRRATAAAETPAETPAEIADGAAAPTGVEGELVAAGR